LAVRYERLTFVVNAILEASLHAMNRQLRRHWLGNVGVDATPIPAFARSERRERGKKRRGDVLKHSADHDAGLYVRAANDAPRPERKVRDIMWAFEATLVVAANDEPGSERRVPPLALAMAPLDVPGRNIGENATIALANLHARGYPAAWLGVDRAYTNAQADKFQLPSRALGYNLVLDYMVTQLGVQASYDGALLVEGAWYCAALPEALKSATIHLRNEVIDEATYQRLVEARGAYLARPKADADDEGHQRWKCPASDGGTTARCELKPRSESRGTRGKTRILVTDELLAMPPSFCTQQTITIPPTAGAKYVQELQYGSLKWRAMYAMLRNTNEGLHGIAKDGAHSPLDDPTRRRIRGLAAQSIFAALALMATNLQQIESFLARAEQDHDGALRTPRRRRRRATPPITDWLFATPARSGASPPT
jgi:hypothetical protein